MIFLLGNLFLMFVEFALHVVCWQNILWSLMRTGIVSIFPRKKIIAIIIILKWPWSFFMGLLEGYWDDNCYVFFHVYF